MKPNGLIIAVGVLAILGGLVYWSNKTQAGKDKDKDKTPGAADTTKLLTIPDDQFQRITIKKLTGESIALSRENGKWRMTEPKPMAADQDAVTAMTGALGNLNADKVIEEKPADLQ